MRLALQARDAFLRRLQISNEDLLPDLLGHAVRHIPHYQRDSARLLALGDFPVIDRETMQTQRAQFLADTLAEEWHGKPPFSILTNATLGPSLEVAFDLAGFYDFAYVGLARCLAEIPGLIESLEPGETTVFSIAGSDYAERFTMFVPSLGGTLLEQVLVRRSASEDADTVARLRGADRPVLYGKPHELLRLAELDARDGLAALDPQDGPGATRIRPRAILLSGDPLYDAYRTRLAAHFACPILNSYIASEAGVIAIECPERRTMHVQTDRVLLEVLRDDGRLAPDGVGELVVTNLFNWGQVFIRYRIGDRGTVIDDDCPCGFTGPSITSFEGRDSQAFVGQGQRISIEQLGPILERPGIAHFGLLQYDEAPVLVRWVLAPGGDRAAVEAELRDALQPLFGDGFRLEHAEHITTGGGKMRRWVHISTASSGRA
ncbi:MAG: phenylacetate--CoA ligase family protein [Myxococcales bacterium]|nr:phenylacetate--CoA ligase family protein [Myxococcales bacterium]